MTENVIDRFSGDNFFLSNFFRWDDWTVEHYFQAAKTDDPVWVAKILRARTPGTAKSLGRAAPLRPTWEEDKVATMRSLLMVKFGHYETLRKGLLDTGGAELIEGNNWHDTFWGVCDGTGSKCQGHSPGLGDNWLGFLLMEVRAGLRAGARLSA